MLMFNSLTKKKFLDLQGFENLAGLGFPPTADKWRPCLVRQAGLQVEPTKETLTCKVSLPKEPPTCKVSLPKEVSL